MVLALVFRFVFFLFCLVCLVVVRVGLVLVCGLLLLLFGGSFVLVCFQFPSLLARLFTSLYEACSPIVEERWCHSVLSA